MKIVQLNNYFLNMIVQHLFSIPKAPIVYDWMSPYLYVNCQYICYLYTMHMYSHTHACVSTRQGIKPMLLTVLLIYSEAELLTN